jgi:AcrR family transcriptional regulator
MSEPPTETGNAARRPRSDAAANRERILAAATIAVRRDGEKVPMATIADEAGVGIGTLYRHYPTRPDLLAALTMRSFNLVLEHAHDAALSDEPAPAALTKFFEQTIAARNDFVLPLHGGPIIHDETIAALQAEIRNLLEQVLARGRRTNWPADKPQSSSQASPRPNRHPTCRDAPEPDSPAPKSEPGTDPLDETTSQTTRIAPVPKCAESKHASVRVRAASLLTNGSQQRPQRRGLAAPSSPDRPRDPGCCYGRRSRWSSSPGGRGSGGDAPPHS